MSSAVGERKQTRHPLPARAPLFSLLPVPRKQVGDGGSLESRINLGREPALCCGSPDAPTVLRLSCGPGFSEASVPCSPLLWLLPASLPNTHSTPRPPTNHPFTQTTQLLCPAQRPGVRASPFPPPPPVPLSLITTLAPPGQGGTDLCLLLGIL